MGFISASLFSHRRLSVLGCKRSRVCSSSQCKSTMSSGGVKFYFAKLFLLLAAESLARADPGYRSPAQLCLPASVRLFIPGCTCVFVGMWRVGKLHRGERVCACVCIQVQFYAVCVCVCLLQHLKTPRCPPPQPPPSFPLSLSTAISLPGRLFQSTRLIKWARSAAERYFYQKAIFRRCPQVSVSQCLRQ